MRQKKISLRLVRFAAANFLLSCCLLSIFAPASSAGPAEQCLDCHSMAWEEGRFKVYRHQPFLERKCRTCHVDSLAEIENPQQGTRQDDSERGRVKWVERNFSPSLNHWFRFPVPGADRILFLEANGRRRQNLQEKIPLPPLEDLSRYDNDNQPPAISDVGVLEVSKRLFLSAVIGWRSDEPATSLIEYGIGKLNHSTPLNNIYTVDHQVAITGLKSGQDYKYRVISEDFFGNRTVSEEMVLSTGEKFSRLEEPEPEENNDREEIEIGTEFYQSDGRYLVRITASEPVEMALGTLPAASPGVGDVKADDSQQNVRHLLVKDAFHLNLSTCYGCHRRYQEGMSHPVNVYPKRGMVIPAEYPTLPDGRMTCSSCHARHASNQKHRLIKPSNKELCVGCHGEMG
ncbi:MAG: cytochrome c3 family protein [Desulfurivibrionaceae bacterium]